MSASHDEQVSLYEELAVTRASAQKALALCQPLFDAELEAKLVPETKALMLQMMHTAMNGVRDMVTAAARVESMANDRVSIKVIDLIVKQIIAAVYDVCGHENAVLAEAIEASINDRVRLPLMDKDTPTLKINLLPPVAVPAAMRDDAPSAEPAQEAS